MKSIILIFPVLMFSFLFNNCEKIVPEKSLQATVQFIIGDAQVDNQPAKIGQKIKNQSIISTGDNSMIEIRMGKYSGSQIRENSRVRIIMDKSGWNIHSYRGAALSLIQPGTNFKIEGPSSVIAVRGTIFYVHSYDDSSQYICTCNGTVDILNDTTLNKTVSAYHHEGYVATRSDGSQILEAAPMKEHTDLEIFDFMYRLERAGEFSE
ncbi:MAG: FecR domain-containing protein [Calditrichaceae bacterium]